MLTSSQLWIPRKGQLDSDWVMHLDAASVLLDAVAREEPLGTGQGLEDHFPIELLSDGEKAAFRFFQSQFGFISIISAVGNGLTAATELSIDRTRAIFAGSQMLRNMLGCDDDVMIIMLDIAVLHDWKKRWGHDTVADLDEFYRRYNGLETRLKDKRAALPLCQELPRPWKEDEQRVVTKSFISACFVYLRTLNFGFYPDMPEIRTEVLRTLEHLESMRRCISTKHLLHNIPSWPYCVAGSLAQKQFHDRVRALNPAPEPGTHPLVLTKWTLDIIEECWRVNQTLPRGAEHCDWTAAMNNLGSRLMLA